MRRCLVPAAVLALIVAGCGVPSPGVTAKRADVSSAQVTQSSTPNPEPTAPDDGTTPPTPGTTAEPDATTPPPNSVPLNPDDATIDFGVNKTPQPYDDFLQAALADIQDFWRETFPQLYGSPYTELSGGIYAAYPERVEPIPACGEPGNSTYEEVAQGGAFYCEFGDFIAYDDAELVPDFSARLGNSAVAIVLAHEFGHAIQQRADILSRRVATVYLEQQADCFAGAWTAHVARGESASLTFGDTEVKSGLIAMVEVKDPIQVGGSVLDDNAHGSAFDRVGAFQAGFLEGAEKCATLIDDPLPLLNLQFTSNEEVANGGDLPYAQIADEVAADLTRFWNKTFTASGATFDVPTLASYPSDGPYPNCDGVADAEYRERAVFCSNLNQIVYDENFAQEIYQKFGDFAVGYLIGDAWSDDVQTQLSSPLTGEQRALASDCLTGAWTKDTIPPEVIDPKAEQQLFVSPGDLDEVVSTALVMGDSGQQDNIVGSGFEKIASYRSGVLGGIAACGV